MYNAFNGTQEIRNYLGFREKYEESKDELTVRETVQILGGEKGEAEVANSRFVLANGEWNLENKAVKKLVENSPEWHSAITKADASKMMNDGGNRLRVTDMVVKLGRARRKPTTANDILTRLDEYFALCQYRKVPPTYPLFAVWCGMSIEELEGSWSRMYPAITSGVDLAKETIRGFLEMSAMDATLSPLIYFHQQKVYFGAIETNKVQIEAKMSTDEQVAQMAQMLNNIQNSQNDIIDLGDVT